jgi:hypothetical protein
MKEPANSPLELYEKAYRLHYDEGDVREACRVYKAIIDEFPDSTECGYAVIQLEKILANTVSENIHVSSRWVSTLAIISLVLSVITCVVVIVMGSVYVKTLTSRCNSLSLMSQALGKMYKGKDKEALEILDNAKLVSGYKEITPFLLSADIYVKKQQFSRAMAEYDTLKKLSGADAVAAEEIAKAKAEEAMASRSVQQEKPALDSGTLQKPAVEKSEPPAPKEIKVRPKKESQPAPKPAKSRKAPGAAQRDSVSFF